MPGERLANSVRAKRFQIVHGDRGAGFGQAVPVGDGNSQVVEKLQRLRLRECAPDDDGFQLPAESCVDFPEEFAAEPQSRTVFRKSAIECCVWRRGLCAWRRGRSVESCLQTFLQIFQDQRHKADVRDFVFRESFADIFGTQGAEMDDGGATGEGAEKPDHEIDSVIRGEDA